MGGQESLPEGTVYVTRFAKFKPEHEKDAEANFQATFKKALEVDGVLYQCAHPVDGSPGEFVVYEAYKNMEAFENFKNSDVIKSGQVKVKPWLLDIPVVKVSLKRI